MRNFPGVIYCFWHHVGLEFFMLRVKLRIESSICLVKSIFYNLHGKVVNVSQESHSFKSCPKAEIDCVENKKTFFNAVSKFVSELVKYWVEKSQRRGREGTRWALTSFQFCKKREGFIWKHVQNYLLIHVWKHQLIHCKVASALPQFLY